MSSLSQNLTALAIVVGAFAAVVGVAIGAMSVGYALAVLALLGLALFVLWEHVDE